MNDLPILIEPFDDGTTAGGWTLGPTWHQERGDDYRMATNRPPHLNAADCPADPSEGEAHIRRWAENAIKATTNYIVTGWNGAIPTLKIVVYILEVHTVGGHRRVGTIRGHQSFASVFPNGVEKLMETAGSALSLANLNGGDTTAHIPVRAISVVDISVTEESVPNRS